VRPVEVVFLVADGGVSVPEEDVFGCQAVVAGGVDCGWGGCGCLGMVFVGGYPAWRQGEVSFCGRDEEEEREGKQTCDGIVDVVVATVMAYGG